MGYQMERLIGCGFKLPHDGIRGSVNLKGMNFDYHCLVGEGPKNQMVEVVGFEMNQLLVRPTETIKERDVNYIEYR
ncbi:hypothetical protein OL233_09115 [Vagococcus sp. PNs007]|uniref:Uncharacterized protein n=1 Tax=Vagococcus proximus TaxID=2991417 RepID=A0ABT5X363_9ENTE|nr:hypothetical protein [Vagococcus proximus]MDF0480440.1 hypothetical protein [Vagococcus proximus]